jgi:hypothetical protein
MLSRPVAQVRGQQQRGFAVGVLEAVLHDWRIDRLDYIRVPFIPNFPRKKSGRLLGSPGHLRKPLELFWPLGAESMPMDIAFACDECGQHLVIDEAGAGMTVQCPTCSGNLIVPTNGNEARKPDITINLESAIQHLLNEIDAGLLEDDQKQDDFIRKGGESAAEAVYGKRSAQAFFRGEISARELMKCGNPLSAEEFASIGPHSAKTVISKSPLVRHPTKSSLLPDEAASRRVEKNNEESKSNLKKP